MDLAFSVAATIAGDGCRIRIPNLGWVRMRETLRFTGKILSATISRVADRWFASITVDTQERRWPWRQRQGEAAPGEAGS